MAVFSQEKTVCLLNTQEIDKWQFLQTVCLFLGCLIPHRVDEWQFSSQENSLLIPQASVDEWQFSPRKQFVRLQTKSLAPQKSAGPYDNLSKTSGQKGRW